MGLAAAVHLSIDGIGGPLQVLIRLGRARRRYPVAGATGPLTRRGEDECCRSLALGWG